MFKKFLINAHRDAAIERARKANHEAFSLPETSFTSVLNANSDAAGRAKAKVVGEGCP